MPQQMPGFESVNFKKVGKYVAVLCVGSIGYGWFNDIQALLFMGGGFGVISAYLLIFGDTGEQSKDDGKPN